MIGVVVARPESLHILMSRAFEVNDVSQVDEKLGMLPGNLPGNPPLVWLGMHCVTYGNEMNRVGRGLANREAVFTHHSLAQTHAVRDCCVQRQAVEGGQILLCVIE